MHAHRYVHVEDTYYLDTKTVIVQLNVEMELLSLHMKNVMTITLLMEMVVQVHVELKQIINVQEYLLFVFLYFHK